MDIDITIATFSDCTVEKKKFNYYFTPGEFFTPVLAGSLSMES